MSSLRKLGESAATAVLERVGRGVSRVQERKPLPYDLLESDDAYLVVFDAPGATRSDVQVRFVDGEVQVRVDRFRDFHEGFEMRFPGRGLSLDGAATLPEDAVVDAEDATATLATNGTLSVRVPKERDAGAVEVADEDAAEDAGEADPAGAAESGAESTAENAEAPDAGDDGAGADGDGAA
ncbi:MAG: Hsp20/alpha crystallin family protein [Haloferacaceae archaeon]